MPSPALLQQTQQSLAALRDFAQTTRNTQLLDHLARLEAALAALSAASGAVASGDITVGNISDAKAIRIGHDINIIVNQALPPTLKQSWQAVQQKWGAAHLEIRKLAERGQGQHIFLSYSRADAEAAFAIRRALEEAGHAVWQDLTAIKGGDEWIKSIEAGVERCYALVMVASAAFEHSEWMKIEYLHARRRGKPIIPILVDESEIPTLLLATQVIHAYPDLETGIQQLLGAAPRPPAAPPPAEDRRALEVRYLDSLLLEHSVWQQVYTPMAGVGQMRVPAEAHKPAAPGRVRMRTTPTAIDVVYKGQKTASYSAERPELAEPKHYEADIVPAVEEMRRLVILGDPGAGKTTTLWKILSDYALKAKDDPRAPLPVLVQMGAWRAGDWPATIASQLGPLAAHYPDLLNEKRLVFLLDGLNELPAEGRDAHLEELRKWLEHCQSADLVVAVTCRELDYTGPLDLNLPGRVTITPLDPIRIRAFVNAYIEEAGLGDDLFWQLAGQDAQKEWEQFSREVGEPMEVFWLADALPEGKQWGWKFPGYENRNWEAWIQVRKHPRSMLSLASNPYMLFMMTQVFTETGELPRNRGLLFQTFIDYLLEKREHLSPEVATEVKMRLADLAYALQKAGAGTTFSVAKAMEFLQTTAVGAGLAPARAPARGASARLAPTGEQILYHARSANLLGGGDEARFTHQLLQEYFAAHHLQTLMAHSSATALFPRKNWWEPQGWEETLILLAGLYNDDCTPVVEWLKDAQPEVAARCIVESGAHCPDETLEALRALWTPRLTDLKRDPEAKARAAAGRALGRLRLGGLPLDNRKGVSVFSPLPVSEATGRGAGSEGLLPDIDWVEIPAGEFIYQKNEKRSEPAFYIARYPITYAQFQTFIDNPHGFADPRWWEGLAAREEHKRAPGEQWFKFHNHPRDDVSWYDAVAFCRWLTELAHTNPQALPAALRGKGKPEITLPTEWQWEKAARGQKGNEYAYGKTFDAARANTSETGIGQTSAVGIFPNGASPYGVLELSGNVWEWCLNEYDKPKNIGLGGSQVRVVRGGSWIYDRDGARAAVRNNDRPGYRLDGWGVRVCVRPPTL